MLKNLKNFLLENQTLKQTIAKNTFWLFLGQILNRLLKAVLIIYAARVLGAEGYGVFSFALSFIMLVMIFSDIGIGSILIRETSKTRDEAERNKYLSTSFYLKIFLLAVCTGLIIVGTVILPNKEAAKLLWILLGLLAFSLLKDYFLALTRALEKMEIEAMNVIIEAAAIVILGLAFLKISPTAQNLSWAYSLGTFIGFVFLLIAFRRYLKITVSCFEASLVKKIISWAWPFAIVGVISSILSYTDTLLLGWLKPIETVGWYSAASKIPLLFIIPANLVSAAILPALSRLSDSQEKFIKLIRQSIGLLLTIGFPAAAGGIILAKPIIKLIFGGQYLPSIPSFKILFFLTLINYGWLILGSALFVKNLQTRTMIFSAIAAAINVALNLLLIPYYSLNGAAAASVISQFIGFVLALLLFRKTTHSFPVGLEEIKKPALAVLAMVLVLLIPAIRNSALWLNIPLAGFVYFFFLYVLKAPVIREAISLYKNYSANEEKNTPPNL